VKRKARSALPAFCTLRNAIRALDAQILRCLIGDIELDERTEDPE
jgi:hypothetical protein